MEHYSLKEKLAFALVGSMISSAYALVWGMPEMLYTWTVPVRFCALVLMTAVLFAGTVGAAFLAAMVREAMRIALCRVKRNAAAVQLCGRDGVYVGREAVCRAAGRGR